MPEIGFLNSGSRAEFAHLLAAFRDGLKLKGFELVRKPPRRRRDVRIRYEWANGDYSKLPGKAQSLVDKGVDLIAATGGIGAARAASQIGSDVPILFASGRDATKAGDPAANAKGVHLAVSTPKVEDHNRYKRLRELLGDKATIYQLINKESPVYVEEGHWSQPLMAASLAELKAQFRSAAGNKAAGILVSGDPFFNSHRAAIVQLANSYRIPTCYPWREYVEAGGLMSHGPNLRNVYRRLGVWAAMVLDGARAEDLPDTDAGHREFVVHLKTAKKLGIADDKLNKLLLMADVVIR